MTATRFEDLPQVLDEDDKLRVHETAGLFFVNSEVAHASADCEHLDGARLVLNTHWRVASDGEVRTLRLSWCQSCFS